MRYFYAIILLLLLQLSMFDIAYGHSAPPRIYELQQIQDLPQSEVNAVYEDRRGFIWIGTLDGLYRYDGCNYTAFQIDGTQQSLTSNMILAIDEDNSGNIWVGTYGRGVSRVNPQTGEVTNYNFQDFVLCDIVINDIGSIAIDKDNNMWLGNWYGILKVKLSEESCDIEDAVYYPIGEQRMADRDCITAIHEDRLGNIWIGSNNFLRRLLEERDGELICEEFSLTCSDICDYDDSSVIAVGSEISLISKVDGEDRYASRKIRDLKYNATNVICGDSSNIWIGSRQGVVHLHLMDDMSWAIAMRHTKENIPFELPSMVVSSMILTQSNQIWVGSRSGGVFTIGAKLKLFNNFPEKSTHSNMSNHIVKAIYEDSNRGLWVGTEESGVYYQYRDIDNNLKMLNIEVNSTDNRAYAFEQTGTEATREIMWVGTTFPDNLVAIDMATAKPISLKFDLLKIGFVFALKKSDENTLWAGTYNNGLWRLKLDDYGEVVDLQHFVTSNSTLSSNIIRSLYLSKSGDLIVGTDMGVSRIAKEDIGDDEPQFLRTLYGDNSTTLDDYYVLQITEDGDGNMLIGTMGHGLLCYNVANDTITNITTNSGLANGSVKSIVEDPESGDLWLSTNRGLSRYTPSSKSIINYDGNDGLLDCEFSEICGIRRANGRMLFGNRFGYVAFDPNEIKRSEITPKLYFTDLYINHKLVDVGDKQHGRHEILSKRLEYTTKIDLEYNQRNFSIGFVGLNFASPLGNLYQVKLEGMDNEWREIRGAELIAQYTNVQEGDYSFRVKAANSDGVWSEEELKLDIHIYPPWYRSVVAYIIYILLVTLAIYWIYWFVSTISRRKQQVLIAQMEQHRTEEMVQYKLEFFMNISHEFRTPLTLINIPLEKMISKIDTLEDQEMVNDISEMKYNVDMLLSLVNQLLDFRKIERGKEHIEPKCINLVEYLNSYLDHFCLLAKKQNIEYIFKAEEQMVAVDIDVRLFEKVIVNILSNAFKYTPSGGLVELRVGRDNEKSMAVITLKDNGKGVAKEEIPYLFDRFYQANNQSQSATHGFGSGIGLSLTKGIVEMHNGQMRIESEINQGLTCIIELPLSQGLVDVKSIKRELTEEVDVIIANKECSIDVEFKRSNSGRRDVILIVEDNERLRNQLGRQLSDMYDILSAENGQVGLDICLKEHPSLVIADIMMPVMDGIEMCRRIKEDETISHTPIMVLSANSTVRNQIDSFTIGGADGYLDKPFNLNVLKSKIQTILHNREILKQRFHRQSIINPEDIAHSPADLKCLSQIIAIIKKNMSNSELSMELIATEYGVSRTYLNRKIKALTGETSSQFLRNIRLKYAAKLLLQKSMNVSEVAWEVGYNDVKTFRTRFKEMFGVSPTNYNGEEASSSDVAYLYDDFKI